MINLQGIGKRDYKGMKRLDFILVQFEDLTGKRNGISDFNETFLYIQNAIDYAEHIKQSVSECDYKIYSVRTKWIDDNYFDWLTDFDFDDECTYKYIGMDCYDVMNEIKVEKLESEVY